MNSFIKSLHEIEHSANISLLNHLVQPSENALSSFEKNIGFVPNLLQDIYSICDGLTIDFMAGLQLMSSSEIVKIYNSSFRSLKEYDMNIIPFLKDYDGNYLVYAKIQNEESVIYFKDGKSHLYSNDIDSFYSAFIKLYTEHIYYFEDGNLSVNFDRLSNFFQDKNKYQTVTL